MTDEIDQIVAIIQLSLPTYSVSKTTQSLAPSVYVEIDSVDSRSIVKEQTYQLHIMATSAANLKAAVDTMLKLDLSHPSAYTSASMYSVSQSLTPTNHKLYEFNGATWTEITSEVGRISTETARNSLVLFELTNTIPETATITAANLKVTANTSTADISFKANVGIDSDENMPSDFSTIKAVGIFATGSWTAAHEYTLTVSTDGAEFTIQSLVEALLADENFDGTNIVITFVAGSNPADQKFDFDTLQLNITYANTYASLGYPYEVETKYKNQSISENTFEADILLLARWSNI